MLCACDLLIVLNYGGVSKAVHTLLKETANATAFKHWRQARAKSPQAAVSGYVATYHRRWGGIARMVSARLKLARARWAGRGAPDPSARQGASDFDPASHADFGAATHPGVGGGTHRRRATADRCLVVWSCVSFVCSVVWWFLCCVCCACDLCFVKLWHLRAGYPASNLKIFFKQGATRTLYIQAVPPCIMQPWFFDTLRGYAATRERRTRDTAGGTRAHRAQDTGTHRDRHKGQGQGLLFLDGECMHSAQCTDRRRGRPPCS